MAPFVLRLQVLEGLVNYKVSSGEYAPGTVLCYCWCCCCCWCCRAQANTLPTCLTTNVSTLNTCGIGACRRAYRQQHTNYGLL